MTQLNTFLVGGAVRDKLLNRPVHDKDWVVVGATPEELLSQGYTQVGADFPVFLHPETKEEYALARQERKTGKGHKGFTVSFSQDVTLEEDLSRRDLTMNAIAMKDDGTYVDPYQGIDDIKNGIIRHVGPAFAEDPLRILRVARFAARYPHFKVAPETLSLMKEMVHLGQLSELPYERVLAECNKALESEQPSRFFEVLRQVDADIALFSHDFHVKQIHSSFEGMDLERFDTSWLFALAFSKGGMTPFQTAALGHRMRLPNEYQQTLQLIQHFEKPLIENSSNVDIQWDVFQKSDAVRKPERFIEFLTLLETQEPVDFSRLKEATKQASDLHFGNSLDSIEPKNRAAHVLLRRKEIFTQAWFLADTKNKVKPSLK